MTPVPVPSDLPQQVERALDEDIGTGDLTAALIPREVLARASVITREEAIVCGIPYVDAVFRRLDERVRIEWLTQEGARTPAGEVLFIFRGRPGRS